jgi:hypothetical protein
MNKEKQQKKNILRTIPLGIIISASFFVGTLVHAASVPSAVWYANGNNQEDTGSNQTLGFNANPTTVGRFVGENSLRVIGNNGGCCDPNSSAWTNSDFGWVMSSSSVQSFHFWVNISSTTGSQLLIGDSSLNGVSVHNGNLVCGSNPNADTGISIPVNQWVQIDCVLNTSPSLSKAYINGSLVYSTSTTEVISEVDYIGGRNGSSISGATMSDFAVWLGYGLTASDITCLYTSGVKVSLDGSCTGSGGVESVSFVQPVNGTTTEALENWLFKVNNVSTTRQYTDVIEWKVNGYTEYLFDIKSNWQGTYNPRYQSTQVGQQNPFISLLANATASVNATLYLFENRVDQTYDYTNGVLASTSIVYTLQNTGKKLVNTIDPQLGSSSQYEVQNNNSPIPIGNQSGTTVYSQCGSAPALIDVGGGIFWGLCNGVYAIFYPSNIASNALISSTVQFNNVVPFSIFFDITGALSSSLNAYGNATSDGISIGIKGFRGEQVNLATLNATTFYNFASSTTPSSTVHASVDYVNQYIVAMLWIIGAVAMIAMLKYN